MSGSEIRYRIRVPDSCDFARILVNFTRILQRRPGLISGGRCAELSGDRWWRNFATSGPIG